MKPRSITFHYTLKDKAGNTVDSSYDGEPMSYVEGASQIIPGLEDGLEGCTTGQKLKVEVTAEDAYGERDERLVIQVPVTELPQGDKTEIGQEFSIEIAENTDHLFRVTDIGPSHATLDGNHPLAGVDLFFDIEVKEAREATEEEVEAANAEDEDDEHEHHEGCSHGPGGHTH